MSEGWWRSTRARRAGAALVMVVVAGGLVLLQESDPTEGDRYGGPGVRVGAEVIGYHPPGSSRDATGVVTVAYRVGSSEMRADIETEHDDFGPTVDIVYDPDHPGRARVADE